MNREAKGEGSGYGPGREWEKVERKGAGQWVGKDHSTHSLPVDRIIRRVRVTFNPTHERVELRGADKEFEVGLLVDVAVLGRSPAVDLVVRSGTVNAGGWPKRGGRRAKRDQ